MMNNPVSNVFTFIFSSFAFQIDFLAAMSSSRSDVVTQFVRSFVSSIVMKEFLKLKQDLLGVLSSPEEFQLCFKNV